MSPLDELNVILPVNDGFVIVGVLIVGDVNVLFINVCVAFNKHTFDERYISKIEPLGNVIVPETEIPALKVCKTVNTFNL